MSLFKNYLGNAFSIHADNSPKYLIFFVTSRCNARCVFCHYKSQIADKTRKDSELTLDEIRQIACNYGKVSKLSFSGGEPFIRDDLPEIIETFIEHSDPGIVDIPTNGGLCERIDTLVRRILPIMGDRVLDIQLSIDGPREVHDRVRGVLGLFDKILHTYELLSPLRETYPNLKLKMNLVYFTENKAATRDLARMFETEYDFDRFQITYPHGESIEEEVTSKIDFEEFYELSKQIQKHYRLRGRRDLHSLIFRSVKMLRDDILKKHHIFFNDMGAVCKAGERILVLDEVGDVYPCEPLWESVGNLREHDYDIKKILQGAQMQAFAEKHLGPGKCTCSWGCVALEKIIYSPSMYPKLLANMAYLTVAGGKGFTDRQPRD